MNNLFKKIVSIFSMLLFILTVFPLNTVRAEEVQKNRNMSDRDVVINAYQEYVSIWNKINNEEENEYGISENKQYKPDDVVRIIVELEGNNIADSKDKDNIAGIRQEIEQQQYVCKSAIERMDSNVEFKRSYEYLLNGFSAEVKYKDIEDIKTLPQVKHVTIAKEVYPCINSASKIGNVNKVFEEYGYKGEGMVISIVDSGVDYTHKDMRISDQSKVKITDENPDGPGKYFSVKVPYGYNFADDNFNIKNDSNIHGMHVAGIAAANATDEEIKGKKNGVRGIAPEAQILAMKIFSSDPSNKGTYMDDVVAAIDESVKQGADIINLSLGCNAGFVDSNDAEQKAVTKAIAQGVVVVGAAGNEQYSTGDKRYKDVVDTGLVSSPGLVKDVIQVASYENDDVLIPALHYESDGGSGEVIYKKGNILPDRVLQGEYELANCRTGTSEDHFKYSKGKIAFAMRGTKSFTEKALFAQEAGAVGIIVWNNQKEEPLVNMDISDKVNIPAVFISYEDAKKLMMRMRKNLKISFSKLVSIDNSQKGKIAKSSSWGPTPSLDFKPNITAPGGIIYSTINDNDYKTMGGTSMATPYISGAAALVLQHLNKLEAEGNIEFNSKIEKIEVAKKILLNTSKVLMDADHSDVPYSPRRQGAGIVDVEAAVKNFVTADVNGNAAASLKEIGLTKKFIINLKNYGNEDITYNIEDLSGVLTEYNHDEIYRGMAYDVKIDGSKVMFNENEITVPANGEKDIEVTIKLPKNTHKNIFVEGFIGFKSVDGNVSDIHMPYIGFYGKWDEPTIVDLPAWDKNTKTQGTMLRSKGANNRFFILGKDPEKDPQNSNKIYEDKIAFNTASEYGYKYNVCPTYAFLRNVKDLEINVLDKDNNIIRNLAQEHNINKMMLKKGIGSVCLDRWKWDGKVYNPQNGEYEPVPDGEYYIQTKARIDYEDADWQTFIMPVKVDSTEASLIIYGDKVSNSTKYKLCFKAEDELSGIDGFIISVNGQLVRQPAAGNDSSQGQNPEDAMKNRTSFLKLEPNENNEYMKEIDLKEGIENIVKVYVQDYAGNVTSAKFSIIVMKEKGDLVIKSPRNNETIESSSFIFKYHASEEIMSKVQNFKINLRGQMKESIDNGKNLEYEFKDLQPGKYKVSIAPFADINGDGEEEILKNKDGVPINASVDITVLGKSSGENIGGKFGITFNNIKSGQILNNSDYMIKGSVGNTPKIFKIGNKDIIVKDDLTFEVQADLKEGLNKVPVYIESKNGEKQEYVLNVYGDFTAPKLELDNFDSSDDIFNINVSPENKVYTISGKVKDNLYGFDLFINGNVVESVKAIPPHGGNEEKQFKYDVNLEDYKTNIEIKAVDRVGNTIIKKIIVRRRYENPINLELISPEVNKIFEADKDIKIKVKAKNVSEESKTAAFIIGLYDESNKLINYSCGEYELLDDTSINISGMIKAPKEGKYKVRCFVWDSIDNMDIISNTFEFEVKDKNVEK